MSPDPQPQSSIILYQTEDGRTRIQCRFEDNTVWLTQALIAELFQVTPQNVTMHLKAIYAEGELAEEATCKDYLQVRGEGGRRITRSLQRLASGLVLMRAKQALLTSAIGRLRRQRPGESAALETRYRGMDASLGHPQRKGDTLKGHPLLIAILQYRTNLSHDDSSCWHGFLLCCWFEPTGKKLVRAHAKQGARSPSVRFGGHVQ